jgi:tetratricopeptide (TPR) repeat protein
VSIYFVIQEEDNSLKRIVREEFNLSGDNRVAVWRSGIEGWKEKPLLGWGPENYDLVFARHFDSRIFLPEYGANLWYDRAHNIVADTLAMGGILGMLSYLGLFAGAFYVLWKKFLAGQLYFITAGVFTVLLFSYFFQNLTVFDMISSYMMFFMVLGFIGSLESEKEEEVSRQNNPSSLGLITIVSILCIFVASFFTFVIQPMRSSSYMIKAIRTPDLEARIYLYEKALGISPLGRYQMRETLERETFILLDQERIESISMEKRKRILDFVSQELEKNIEESPLLFSSYLKLGRVYNIYAKVVDQSKLDRASEVLEKAVEVSPTYQQAYWYLSQTRLFQGDLEEAIKLAEKAIQLEPRVEKSHLVAVDTARIVGRLTGDYEKALELANKAIEINPEWRENIEFILQQ